MIRETGMAKASKSNQEKATKDRKPAVKWTDEELEVIGRTAWDLYIQHPDKTIMTIFQMAQEKTVPKDRQRVLTGVHNLDKVFPYLYKAREEFMAKDSQIELLKKQIDQLQNKLEHHADLDQIWEKSKDELLRTRISIDDILTYCDIEDIIEEIPTERLVGYAAQRFAEATISQTNSLLELTMDVVQQSQQYAAAPSQLPLGRIKPKAAQEVVILPKVAFIGLKPEQHNIVSSKLKGLIQYVQVDKKATQIPKECDLYVLWTRFISHSTERTVRSFARMDQVIRHHGGLETMVEKVKEVIRNL